MNLRTALQAVLPADAGYGVCRLDNAPEPWPEEIAALGRAVDARRREFAAGRAAARDALRMVGHAPVALPVGHGRAPVWPKGMCGSISHGGGVAVATCVPAGEIVGIGVDVEPAAPLPCDLRPEILHGRDLNESGLDDGLAARIIFSAKESLFKAQFPSTGLWLDFEDAAITLHASGFAARILDLKIAGRWAIVEGVVLSALWLSAEQIGQLRSLDPDIVPR